jgi:hypothetical protein
MTHVRHQAVLCAVGLALGIAAGCAGKRRASQDPNQCMRNCDQEKCTYQASGSGDNAEYLDCLDACEKECGGGGDDEAQ